MEKVATKGLSFNGDSTCQTVNRVKCVLDFANLQATAVKKVNFEKHENGKYLDTFSSIHYALRILNCTIYGLQIMKKSKTWNFYYTIIIL